MGRSDRILLLALGGALIAIVLVSILRINIDLTGPSTPAWVEAIGAILAVIAAIVIPLRIRQSEAAEVLAIRAEYKHILLDALRTLYAATANLTAIQEFADVNNENFVQVGEQILLAYSSMREAIAVLNELAQLDRLDRYGAVRALFRVRQKIEELLPTLSAEARILERTMTRGTVQVSVNKLTQQSDRLRGLLGAAIAELERR